MWVIMSRAETRTTLQEQRAEDHEESEIKLRLSLPKMSASVAAFQIFTRLSCVYFKHLVVMYLQDCVHAKTERQKRCSRSRENFIYFQISLTSCCLTLWPCFCVSYCLLQESSQYYKAFKTFFVPAALPSLWSYFYNSLCTVCLTSTSLFPEICTIYGMCVFVRKPLPWIQNLFWHVGGDSNSRLTPWYQSSISTSQKP